MSGVVGKQPLKRLCPYLSIVACDIGGPRTARFAESRYVPDDRGHAASLSFQECEAEALVF
jgi:hypothetical protein